MMVFESAFVIATTKFQNEKWNLAELLCEHSIRELFPTPKLCEAILINPVLDQVRSKPSHRKVHFGHSKIV